MFWNIQIFHQLGQVVNTDFRNCSLYVIWPFLIVVRFGAYTASGITTTPSNKTGVKRGSSYPNQIEKRDQGGKCSSFKESSAAGSAPTDRFKRNGLSKSVTQIQEDPTGKVEFHRLAVVALPLENSATIRAHKCNSENFLRPNSNSGTFSLFNPIDLRQIKKGHWHLFPFKQ